MHSGQLIRLVSGDDLAALIGAFIDDCALANLSPKTLRFYQTNLERYRWWCEQTGVPLDPTLHTSATLREFLRYVQTAEHRWGSRGNAMSDKPVGDKTLHAYYRVVHRFFGWLVEQEYRDDHPMGDRLRRKIRAPKVRKDQPDPFSADELARLAATLKADGEGVLAVRNRAMVAVLLDVGLRASELAGIGVEHLDVTSGRLWIEAGKGNKARELRLGAAARKPVRRYWLRHRRHLGEGAFFLAVTGEGLTGQGVHDMTTKLGKRAGVYPCNPHRFRHHCATASIRAGMGVLQLQQMLGHTSLDMVRRYVKLAEQDVMLASQQHSALDSLKLGL